MPTISKAGGSVYNFDVYHYLLVSILPMSQLLDVTTYLQRGFKLTLSRGMRPWVIIPLAFNIVFFSLMYWLAGHYINLWVDYLTSGWQLDGFWTFLNSTLSFLAGALKLLLWVLLLVIFASVFTLTVQLVASPFLGLLAEKVNKQTSPLPLPTETFWAMTKRTLIRETRKLLQWLTRAAVVLVFVLVLYLIPGLNLLASAVWFLFCGWMMALQYIDYGADCRQHSLNELKHAMHSKRWLVLGFGSIMLGLTMLPLVNLIIMPIGVVTGTLIWNERLSPKALPSINPLAIESTP